MNPTTSPWALWAPVLVSAVLVFIASSVSQAVLHRNDFAKLPGELEVMDTLRRLEPAPADYLFPRPANRADLASPEFKERYRRGPIGILTIFPEGGNPIARSFPLWFAYCVAVGAFAAFVASRSLPPGTNRQAVFVLVAVAAFGAHAMGLWPATIWYGKALSTTLKSSFDGLVYGILTGGTFALMWPR